MSDEKLKKFSKAQYEEEIEKLRVRLEEAEQTLSAIRNGEVDALVVNGPMGDQIYTLTGADSIYRVVVETMSEAALMVSFGGTILFCNNQFSKLLKKSVHEIVGRKVLEFAGDSQKNIFNALLNDAKLGMVKRRVILRAADSSSVPVMISTSLLSLEGGQGICLVATDLSELENSIASIQILMEQQKKLEEQEAQLRESHDEAVKLMEDAIEAKEKEERLNSELFTEIKERKKAEEALLESNQRIQEIFESISDAFFSLDPEWRFTYINRRAAANLGCVPELLVGKRIWDTFPANIDAEQETYCRKAMDEHIKVEFETRGIMGPGWNNIRIYPSADGISVYIVDITERKRADEALKGAYENLQAQSEELQAQSEELQAQSEELHSVNEELQAQSEKLKAKSEELFSANDGLNKTNKELEQFAYIASHDLQEPLRTVTSFAQLLEKRYKDQFDKDALEYFTYIIDGAKRMEQIVEDLLQFSRIGRSDNETCLIDCNDIIDRVKQILTNSINNTNAKVTYDDLPVLNANETRLIQLFQNLIGNAIKFHKIDEHPRVHISARRDTSHWLFSVKDNGIGIKPKYFEKIFVIFQRLHGRDEYTGTGIGLAISKKIVEFYGGKIWVESTEGEGATFYFTFPI
jgi:PAS domain S-box-containing protein